MGWNGQDFGRHGRHPACEQQDRRSAHQERDGQARRHQQDAGYRAGSVSRADRCLTRAMNDISLPQTILPGAKDVIE